MYIYLHFNSIKALLIVKNISKAMKLHKINKFYNSY